VLFRHSTSLIFLGRHPSLERGCGTVYLKDLNLSAIFQSGFDALSGVMPTQTSQTAIICELKFPHYERTLYLPPYNNAYFTIPMLGDSTGNEFNTEPIKVFK